MKNRLIIFSEFFSGILFILYSITIHSLVPGTFAETISAFCNVWIFVGAILIFCAIIRIKTSKSIIKFMNKKVKLSLGSLVLIGVFISVINLSLILTPRISKNPQCSNVILLGGGIDKNGNLPKIVIPRIYKTAEYLSKNPSAIVVVSGGSLKNLPAEAPALKKYLVALGIDEQRILVEDKALDTIQNLQFSCSKLADYYNCSKSQILVNDVLIITSRFHLRRAQRLAKRMGYKSVYGLGTKIPALNALNTYSREICAYIKLNLRILLTKKPSQITE